MKYTGRALYTLYAGVMIFALAGCANDTPSSANEGTPAEEQPRELSIPAFNKDSAYFFVEKQVAFGPRNPGSDGIVQCREWLISRLELCGAEVRTQEFEARLYTGESFPSVNIIGSFNPGQRKRILLAAHYDTRFIAEEDADPTRKNDPIAGADDGASGVGVLLEVARLLKLYPVDLGVDIIFFDAEDQGKRSNDGGENETWCLGAQYWGRNMHTAGYSAKYGILLDMVGAKNAFFNKENLRGVHANAAAVAELYNKVWNLANAMGKGRYFQNRTIGGIIDDHYFVNRLTGIPMIDIINKPPGSDQGFGDHWHTHNDDMDIIDRNTLGSVGQVVVAVLYREDVGRF